MPKRSLERGVFINCSNNTEAPQAHRGMPLKLKNDKDMFLGQPNLRQPNLGIADCFPQEKGKKTVRIVKNYGGSKIVRIRAPLYF